MERYPRTSSSSSPTRIVRPFFDACMCLPSRVGFQLRLIFVISNQVWSRAPQGENEGDHGPRLRVFRPNPALVLADDRPADRQTQTAARPVPACRVGSVLLENAVEMFFRDGRARIANIDTVRIRRARGRLPALAHQRNRGVRRAALPEIQVSADFNRTRFRRELTRVV